MMTGEGVCGGWGMLVRKTPKRWGMLMRITPITWGMLMRNSPSRVGHAHENGWGMLVGNDTITNEALRRVPHLSDRGTSFRGNR